jgi:hypothetical protein
VLGTNETTAVDYFILRLSELEFRVRQTENYIKYADELKDLKASKHSKSESSRHTKEKIEGIELKHNDMSERLLTLESKFSVMDKDLRQSYSDFESKYVNQ